MTNDNERERIKKDIELCFERGIHADTVELLLDLFLSEISKAEKRAANKIRKECLYIESYHTNNKTIDIKSYVKGYNDSSKDAHVYCDEIITTNSESDEVKG